MLSGVVCSREWMIRDLSSGAILQGFLHELLYARGRLSETVCKALGLFTILGFHTLNPKPLWTQQNTADLARSPGSSVCCPRLFWQVVLKRSIELVSPT